MFSQHEERRERKTDAVRLEAAGVVARRNRGALALFLQAALSTPLAEALIFALAVASAAVLAYAGPHPAPSSLSHTVLVVHDYASTILLALEAMLRVVAWGPAVVKDAWFRFDLIVTCICITDLVMSHALRGGDSVTPLLHVGKPAVRGLRILRIFRSLRPTGDKLPTGFVGMLLIGVWESRFVNIYVGGFISLAGLLASIWFADALTSRCVVSTANIAESSLSSALFVQPAEYCNVGSTSASLFGGHSCTGQTHFCAKVYGGGKPDNLARLLTFDNFGSSMFNIFMTFLDQESDVLQNHIMQGTSSAAVLFFSFVALVALVMVNLYSAILYIVYARARLEEKQHEEDVINQDHVSQISGNAHEDTVESTITKLQATGRAVVSARRLGSRNCLDLLYLKTLPSARRAAASIKWAQSLQSKRLPVPHWECMLFLVALLHFTSGFVSASCLGRSRLHEQGVGFDSHSSSDMGPPPDLPLICHSWKHISNVCQWVFSIDLVLKVVRFGGLRGYLNENSDHWLDVSATILILVAEYTWKVPDMTSLRAMRLFSVIFVRQSTWNTRITTFFRKLLHRTDGEILSTVLFLLLTSVILQQLSDGDVETNKFFGSWCASLTTLLRLSADEDLISIIRARWDLDGHVFVVLVVVICFLLKTFLAKIVIASMNYGLEENLGKKRIYQLFLTRLETEHPGVDDWLKSRSSGHKEPFAVLQEAERLVVQQPRQAACYKNLIEQRNLRKHIEAARWDEMLTGSEKILQIALYIMDERIEARVSHELARVEEQSKWIRFTDSCSMTFSEDTWDTWLRRFRTLRKYVHSMCVCQSLCLVLDLIVLIPIMLVGFACSWGSCWIEGVLLQDLEGLLLFAFTAECMFKMLAFGIVRNGTSYFRNVQNCLDFGILALFWLSLLHIFDVPARTIYCTRLVRIVQWLFSCFWTLRWTMKTIVSSLEAIFYVFLLLLSLVAILCPVSLMSLIESPWAKFAELLCRNELHRLCVFEQILLQSYSGRWRTCNDDAASTTLPMSCVGAFLGPFALRENENVHIMRQRSTLAPVLNFDDLRSGCYWLLVLASQDGWSSLFDDAHGWSTPPRGRLPGTHRPPTRREESRDEGEWSVLPLLVYQYFLYIGFWPATVAVYISSQRMCSGSALELVEQKSWRRSVRSISMKYSEFVSRGEAEYGRSTAIILCILLCTCENACARPSPLAAYNAKKYTSATATAIPVLDCGFARNCDATLSEIVAAIRSPANNDYNEAAIAASGSYLCEAL